MPFPFSRHVLWVLLMALWPAAVFAQGSPPAHAEDVATVDAIIMASYAAISHAPGRAADLQRFESLFRPGAQLISMAEKNGMPQIKSGTIEQIARMLQSTEHPERAHLEKEIARRTEQYGDVAHVWSTYESADTVNGSTSRIRGINSISLVKDDGRWWIVSAQWQNETTAQPIPRQYLKGKR